MKLALCAAMVMAVASAANAAVISENFNTDVSANWKVNSGPDSNDVTFAFNYASLGIPAAPGSSDQTGVRLRANNTGTTQALTGISMNLIGGVFTGDYTVQFYAWQNVGPTGTTGTTELVTASIGATANSSIRPGGNVDGVMFAMTSDGGSASDYRAYGPGNTGSQLTGVYAAAGGSQNNTAALYATAFPGGALTPTAQGGTPQASPAGTPASTWAKFEIIKTGNQVVWELNDVVIATIPDVTALSAPFAGTSISLGQSDINATATATPELVFSIIDNLTITGDNVAVVVPEPSSAILAAPALMALRRRRK